jgi:hypothetical protein
MGGSPSADCRPGRRWLALRRTEPVNPGNLQRPEHGVGNELQALIVRLVRCFGIVRLFQALEAVVNEAVGLRALCHSRHIDQVQRHVLDQLRLPSDDLVLILRRPFDSVPLQYSHVDGTLNWVYALIKYIVKGIPCPEQLSMTTNA